jgi:hypothetical protein
MHGLGVLSLKKSVVTKAALSKWRSKPHKGISHERRDFWEPHTRGWHISLRGDKKNYFRQELL